MNAPFIPGKLYISIYLIFIAIITIFNYVKLLNSPSFITKEQKRTSKAGFIILSIIIILFIGTRPLSGAFTDMFAYAGYYLSSEVVDTGEPGFFLTIIIGHLLGLSLEGWFTLIAAVFFICNLAASFRFDKVNGGIIFLTILTAFMTFAYATNTIRSGMAHSLLLLGISLFLSRDKRSGLLGSIMCFLFAFTVHKSSSLALLCFLLSYYKLSVKHSFQFWILSIFLSLFIGNQISGIFQNLGFDDRLDKYLTADDFSGFSHTGFRWDFLMYSSFPIILGYYIIFKRRIYDSYYSILLSTYLLANSFWIMVIRASFSDRFAYLSWFLYPIVLSYPLLKVNIWGKKQGVYAFWILSGHLSFTLFMNFVYY